MRFVVDTIASPAQVQRALTDFTERRLQTWNRTLDPRTYELRDQGGTWAVARESTPGSPFWVVVRYDWSEPAIVRWTITDSSYGGGGDGVVRITPRARGGSRLHAEWDYTGAQRQKTLLFLLQHVPIARRMIGRMWATALDRYAQADASGSTAWLSTAARAAQRMACTCAFAHGAVRMWDQARARAELRARSGGSRSRATATPRAERSRSHGKELPDPCRGEGLGGSWVKPLESCPKWAATPARLRRVQRLLRESCHGPSYPSGGQSDVGRGRVDYDRQ